MAERSALMEGTVVASHGRHCMVETPDGAVSYTHLTLPTTPYV